MPMAEATARRSVNGFQSVAPVPRERPAGRAGSIAGARSFRCGKLPSGSRRPEETRQVRRGSL
jgi:hypothetical protein